MGLLSTGWSVRRSMFLGCAIASHVIASIPAHAEGLGIIAVSVTDIDRGTVAGAVAGAVAPVPPRLVLDAVQEARAAVLAGAVPTSTLEPFRRVRQQIDEGWRAFVRVQVELAASRLAVARTHAEALVALPGGELLYADAALRLGAVLNHLGRTAEAQAALALALALDPDRPITLAEFSPDVVAAIDAARAQARPTTPVRFVSEPAGALISVDGKELGRAPLSTELAVGQHVVVARHPQHEPRAQAIAIDDTTREVALELARDVAWSHLAEGASAGLPDTAAQRLIEAAVQFADLDELVLVASTDRRGGPALLVQRCAGLPARCTAVVELGYADRAGLPAAAREAWQAVRAADLRYPPSVLADARVTGRRGEEPCKLCRSPILWGSVGAAAVIGTIVTIAILSGSRPPPVVSVDRPQF